MIPWDTFKTPLDAYEWAKANIFQGSITRHHGEGDFLVFGFVPAGVGFLARIKVRR